MAIKKKDLPDLKQIDSGLKDFQRKTAAVVFDRLYQKKRSSHRFLVADEVGLGKTLIARSVIARTLHYLWDKTKRIDIIYICSNADIARQNIKRLNVLGDEGKVLPTRITLLPIKIKDLKKNRINFISFTPSTSFDLKSNLGVVKERLLLYWLLKDAWKFSGIPPMNVFQGKVQTRRFRQQIKIFQENHSIDRTLARKFKSTIRAHTRNQRDSGEIDLRKRFKWLCQEFHRSDSKISSDARRKRSKFIGELRTLLAE